MVALNKKTGDVLWSCKELADPVHYASLVIHEIGDEEELARELSRRGMSRRQMIVTMLRLGLGAGSIGAVAHELPGRLAAGTRK